MISMIFYHMVWDLVYLFGIELSWYKTGAGYIWQQSICWMFILLSGFCFPFGRRKLKRGITVFAAGLLITAATCLFMQESRVVFGVLTMLGSCMLIMIPADRMLQGRKPLAGFMCSMFLFLLLRNINSGSLGFEGLRLLSLPDVMYWNAATTYLGFPYADFYSTDYFSLFPWIFLFLTGYYLHYLMKSGSRLEYLGKGGVRWLEWLGRHSLIVYMIHQPVLFAVLTMLL